MMAPKNWRGVRPWERHGLVLAVAGLIYILIGFSYVVAEQTPSRMLALKVAYAWWGPNWWGLIFMMVGVMAVISSRWPQFSETWGYTVLTGLSAGWAMFYFVGVVFEDAPVSNLSAVMSWGLIGFLWWAISGLLNPDGTAAADDGRY